MKWIHLFKTLSQFDEKYNGDYYHEPWVSYTRESGTPVNKNAVITLAHQEIQPVAVVNVSPDSTAVTDNDILFLPADFIEVLGKKTGIFLYDKADWSQEKEARWRAEGSLRTSIFGEDTSFYNLKTLFLTYDGKEYFCFVGDFI
jgi:hypothetical protein